MSGAGRKSVYRKSVTEEYLNGTPEPDEAQGDVIALVKASRGTNIFEIDVGTERAELAMMPTKFKKLIWIKRGDYVLTSSAAEAIEAAGGDASVRFVIKAILSRPQIRHIIQIGKWNSLLPEPTDMLQLTGRSNDAYTVDIAGGYGDMGMGGEEEEEEGEYDDDFNDADGLFDSKGRPRVDKMGNTIEYSDDES